MRLQPGVSAQGRSPGGPGQAEHHEAGEEGRHPTEGDGRQIATGQSQRPRPQWPWLRWPRSPSSNRRRLTTQRPARRRRRKMATSRRAVAAVEEEGGHRWDGGTVAYVSDHQAPGDFDHVDAGVLELCEGVDLIIHEGQYTRREFPAKADWGHCAIDDALRVAIPAGARRPCVFHHDRWRSDDELDALVAEAQAAVAGATEEVIAASEGLTLTVPGA